MRTIFPKEKTLITALEITFIKIFWKTNLSILSIRKISDSKIVNLDKVHQDKYVQIMSLMIMPLFSLRRQIDAFNEFDVAHVRLEMTQ